MSSSPSQHATKQVRTDVLYIEGPGDIVAAYESWSAGEEHATETSVTFSSQLFEHCKSNGLSLVAISYCSRSAEVRHGNWLVANVPRRMLRLPKVGYQLSLFWYLLRILKLALSHRPQLVLLTSGVVSWRGAWLLRRVGLSVVPILHNALWPEGFSSRRHDRELALWRTADPPSTLVVSHAIRRQLAAIENLAGARAIEFRPSFSAAQFPPPVLADHSIRPFRILFAGRLEAEKGVFDLIEIATALEAAQPGLFRFDVCGTGTQAGPLATELTRRCLGDVVKLWGRLPRASLVKRYAAAHLVVVPTRSSFAEGFAQVVAEAILMGRPVVTSPVVPASEPYASAVVLVETDSVAGYVEAIRRLAADRASYDVLGEGCESLRTQILENAHSFESALGTLATRMGQLPSSHLT